jgi:putrescine transport system substrate-binding protein
VAYSIPKEGALIWLDAFTIPADAPHPEEAHTFIDYMLRPEIAARNSNFVNYANGNKASQELLDEGVRGDPAIYPDEATFAKLYTTTPNDQRFQREVTRMWTELKAGQ